MGVYESGVCGKFQNFNFGFLMFNLILESTKMGVYMLSFIRILLGFVY